MFLHVDMDAFYAAVEQRTDPRLAGKPVLICGEPGTRSVVAAASYEARPFGVRAGMSVGEAIRRCPDAVLVPGNPAKYVSLSLRLLELFKSVSPLVEPMSIDEAFLDLRGTPNNGPGALPAASRIQSEVERRYQLSCSVGIGPNRLVAKMASCMRKPRGITRLTREDFRAHYWGKGVSALWGIGEKTSAALTGLGIATIGDLARADRGLLRKAFGINGPRLRQAARGEDETELVPYFVGVANKSMGHEHTLVRDVSDPAALRRLLLRLSDQVTRRMRREGYMGRVVAIRLRDAGFRTRIRQRALSGYTDGTREVYRTALGLWRESWSGEPLRLMGVAVSGLLRNNATKIEFLFAEERMRQQWTVSIDGVRDQFGEESLLPAASLI
jgi:DNA polymerase-4